MKIKFNAEDYRSQIELLQKTFKPRKICLHRPPTSPDKLPELIVTVPDSWPFIDLAPLYDVHVGSMEHDADLLEKHVVWISRSPHVLSWNGGDFREAAAKDSPGGSVYGNRISPMEQVYRELEILARLHHKMLFALSGNHEDRVFASSGIDVSRMVADDLRIPYFADYCLCVIKWRGNNFRIAAHHGSGAAQTPGAQLNAARKDLPWLDSDIIWTGHLHQKRADIVYRLSHDQKTGRMIERNTLVMISPSYLRYFSGYAAKKRMAPGVRGLAVARLHADGRIDASLHAQGERP